MNLEQNLEKLKMEVLARLWIVPFGFGFWFFSSPLMFLKDSQVQPFLNSAALIPCPHLLPPTPARWVTHLNYTLQFSCPQ